MKLEGIYFNGIVKLHILMDYNKRSKKIHILTPANPDDKSDMILTKPSDYLKKSKKIPKGYVSASYKISNLTNIINTYGNVKLVDNVLSLLSVQTSYTFSEDKITDKRADYFKAEDNKYLVEYEKNTSTDELVYLKVASSDEVLELSRCPQSIDVKLTSADYQKNNSANIKAKSPTTIPYVTLEDLESKLDLSFLKNKDYNTIKTVEDFEEYVIKDLCKTYYEDGELILSLDTETNGLNLYYLSEDNPVKSHVVATPLSWKDNFGVTLFHDMKHFDNVDIKYCYERLKPFLEKGGEFEITTNDNITYKLDRNKINLVGHNVLFDGRALYDNKIKPRWNNDTMQLAFNLNPKAAKGKFNNKLKGLTRRIFGHETPELSDLLGKGNEDKYNRLEDERLAKVYGCADADYTRLLFKYLRKLIPDNLYKVYQEQDMEMLNVLYISEYYGMRVDGNAIMTMTEQAKNDLTKIHEFLKNYVGKVIVKKNTLLNIQTQLQMGKITEMQSKRMIADLKIPKDATYEFDMKASNYITIMFEILNYPVISRTENGEPQTGKPVLKKLMSVKNTTPSNQMEKDLISDDGKTVLISAKEFNSYRYPFAYVLSEYKVLEKEYTAYFKPFLEANLENRIFKNYSMSRIETLRIMNPGQTMKGSLKEIILPFDGGKDWYMVDFDMAQVEYRIMASIAGLDYMIERLRDPEKDFHTESAAKLKGIPPHTVDKKFRKSMKCVHFGIPYGLGDRSLCETMFGTVNERTLYETRKLMEEFKKANEPVINMLENHRDNALREVPFSNEFKDFCGMYEDIETPNGTKRQYKPVGVVKNELGRYRLFDLSDMSSKNVGSIRRAAGNYPIQSFAAELFRLILLNFYKRCVKEGIEDKIMWHMLIHDELLLSAHKSVHPFFLYKILLEECMITIKGHTEYFIGINMGDNWADCKDDLAEAPVLFVREMVKRYDAGEFDGIDWIDDPKNYVKKYMKEYIVKRIGQVLKEIQPNIDNEPINLGLIDKNLENYTVRAYIADHFPPPMFIKPNGKLDKEFFNYTEIERFLIHLATWANIHYSGGKWVQLPDGTLVKSESLSPTPSVRRELIYDITEHELDVEKIVGLDDDFEVLDDSDLFFIQDTHVYDEEQNSLVRIKDEYQIKHILDTPRQIIISIPRKRYLTNIQNVLKPYIKPGGKPAVIKTPLGSVRIPGLDDKMGLEEIDRLIDDVIGGKYV